MSILFCKAANLVKHFERFLYFIYRKLVSPAGLHLLVGAGPDLAGPRVSIYCLFLFFILPRYAAQSKTVATEIVILGEDITGPRIQVAPVGS